MMLRKNNSLPIIHIAGLPGVGKSTLAKKLFCRLKIPIYRIGKYRSEFPSTPVGEADAWVALFRDLSKRKWKNCILETTGLNRRELFIRAALPFSRIITIKLEVQRKVLYERLRKKKKDEWGGKWLFSTVYRDKYEFVRKLFKDFKRMLAEIRIDTTKLNSQEVYRVAIEKLKAYPTFTE